MAAFPAQLLRHQHVRLANPVQFSPPLLRQDVPAESCPSHPSIWDAPPFPQPVPSRWQSQRWQAGRLAAESQIHRKAQPLAVRCPVDRRSGVPRPRRTAMHRTKSASVLRLNPSSCRTLLGASTAVHSRTDLATQPFHAISPHNSTGWQDDVVHPSTVEDEFGTLPSDKLS